MQVVQCLLLFLIQNKTSDPEFNKLTAENFTARLKQADIVSKTDFDNELRSFNRKNYFK